jgi:tRNA-dihydrouridine synthase B
MQFNVQLAPMLGLTDPVFMNILHKEIGGYNEMFIPYMLASSGSPVRPQILVKRLNPYNKQISLVPQLLSNDAPGFLHFANLLFDLGYKKVNWNMGCPQPFVTNRGRGAGMLLDKNKISRLLDEVMPQLKPRLSIKTRLGFYSTSESLELIDIFNRYPVDELIIHARTATQQYQGYPGIEAFIEMSEKSTIQLVYNGNIVLPDHALAIADRTPGLCTFMIGRGAFINPFIGLELNGLKMSNEDKKTKLISFYQTLFEAYHKITKSEAGLLNHFKELWASFSQSFEDGNRIFNQLKTIDDLRVFNKTAMDIITEKKLII